MLSSILKLFHSGLMQGSERSIVHSPPHPDVLGEPRWLICCSVVRVKAQVGQPDREGPEFALYRDVVLFLTDVLGSTQNKPSGLVRTSSIPMPDSRVKGSSGNRLVARTRRPEMRETFTDTSVY